MTDATRTENATPGMPPITYTSDQPAEYVKALSDADTLPKLVKVADAWKEIAADAYHVIHTMTDADFTVWRKGLAKERQGRFAGEEWATKYGCVTMPEVLLKVAMFSDQYKVPWGCAYIRLKQTGNLEKALA